MFFGMIKYIPKKKLLLAFLDFIIVSLILYFSLIVYAPFQDGIFLSLVPAILISLFVTLFLFYLFDLYNVENNFFSLKYHLRIWEGVICSTLILGFCRFVFGLANYTIDIFLLNAFLTMAGVSLLRIAFHKVFKSKWKVHNVLVVGTDSNAKLVYTSIKKIDNLRVIGFLDHDPKRIGVPVGSPCVVGVYSDIEKVIDKYNVNKVIISLKNPDKFLLKKAISYRTQGVEFHNMPSFYETITGKIPIESIDESWFIDHPLSGLSVNIYNRRIKRLLDLVLSSIQLVVFSPILLVVVLAIKLSSRGPIFYRQKRVGLNGRKFEVIKFRSMIDGAEKYGAIWATREDDRITPVGKIIRRFRLDEVPQLWNVLKGEMSLIGPRPERPEFVEKLKDSIPFYSLRLTVKPGVTGWAQVNNGYTSSIGESEDKLKFDLYYIKNLSPYIDLLIIFKTIKVMIWGRGAI